MTSLQIFAPVTIDDLIAAYAIAEAAAEGRDADFSVMGEGLSLAFGNNEAVRYQLSDDPLNRAMLAIRNRFPKGMMHVLVLRLTALGEMAGCQDAEVYISADPDEAGKLAMSRAMFAVAAEMPLTEDLSFDRGIFFQRVARAYADNPD